MPPDVASWNELIRGCHWMWLQTRLYYLPVPKRSAMTSAHDRRTVVDSEMSRTVWPTAHVSCAYLQGCNYKMTSHDDVRASALVYYIFYVTCIFIFRQCISIIKDDLQWADVTALNYESSSTVSQRHALYYLRFISVYCNTALVWHFGLHYYCVWARRVCTTRAHRQESSTSLYRSQSLI